MSGMTLPLPDMMLCDFPGCSTPSDAAAGGLMTDVNCKIIYLTATLLVIWRRRPAEVTVVEVSHKNKFVSVYTALL